MRKCEYSKCGKYFEPNKPKQRFCSDVHRVYYNREQKKKREPVKIDYTPPVVFTSAKNIEKINEVFKEAGVLRPKNLDELKSMCPPELKGLERSAWIGTKRQEYGI